MRFLRSAAIAFRQRLSSRVWSLPAVLRTFLHARARFAICALVRTRFCDLGGPSRGFGPGRCFDFFSSFLGAGLGLGRGLAGASWGGSSAGSALHACP